MAESMNKAIYDIICTQLDASEIYDSIAYNELSRKISACGEAIEEKVGESVFSNYSETRIDMEALFYKFGFLEGIRFSHKLMTTTPDELITLSRN